MSHQTHLSPSQSAVTYDLDSLLDSLQTEWDSEFAALNTLDTPSIPPIAEAVQKPASRPERAGQKRAAIRKSQRRPARKPVFSPVILTRTAAALALLAGASASWQWIQELRQPNPEQKIRRVMAQNTQSKVAAFRREVAEGNHFMDDSGKPIQYVVQEGDTVSRLARKFHVNPNTIIKNNDRKKLKADRMKPGTRLTILPVDGIAHPIGKGETIAELAQRYKQPLDQIVEVNDLDNPDMIVENQKLIIPNAAELRLRPVAKPATRNASGRKLPPGAPVRYSQTGKRLSWPSAGIVTSNFGWRWFRMHTGMDVAAPVGTAIRAVKEGRVIYSGWMGGYGYAVDIDHGNGLTTRYAHCSELHVQTGQLVYRGQVLAAMGSTGHSTGPHLHFEVRLNGEAVNPRSYF